MKKIQLFLIGSLAVLGVQAQQLANSSFFDLHGVMYNAAAVGSQQHPTVGGSFRTLWSGMPGAPRTGMVYGNTYLSKSRLGLGAMLFSDVAGAIRTTGANLAISYQVPFQNGHRLSFGLMGMLNQYSIDMAKLESSIPGDPVLSGSQRRFKADAGFGVAYTGANFQFGAAVNQLLQTKLNLYEGAGNPQEESRFYRHYYVHGNYAFTLDEATRLIPNFLVTYLPNSPTEFQVGARMEHMRQFWYGFTWRARQSWSLSAGLRLKERFNIGYAFDLYRTPLSAYDGGANGHEIMLRYDFLK
jgi:type IX secretion system PorP/SprF family membrane protein